MKAYNFCNFFMALDAKFKYKFHVKCLCLPFMVSHSHKKNALDFLDKLCSFYEQKYIFVSPKAAENTQAFLDKVYELAEANGLPSKAFKSALSEFSIDQLRKHVNKVYDFSILVCGPPFIFYFLFIFWMVSVLMKMFYGS